MNKLEYKLKNMRAKCIGYISTLIHHTYDIRLRQVDGTITIQTYERKTNDRKGKQPTAENGLEPNRKEILVYERR